MTTTLLWHNSQLATTEHCIFAENREDISIQGHVVQALHGEPVRIAYHLHLDAQWHTRQVEIQRETARLTQHLMLIADGKGHWFQDGQPFDQMQGCLDVDLGITPSTNTLPIRRLGLYPGEQAAVDAVWVRFPDLTLQRLAQRYTCLDETHYRYESFSPTSPSPYQALLEVDDEGIVRSYEDAWQAIAYARS
jgi:hypothetical protein